MCKKQTSVSHSSTESEIISLDAGLRMVGLPALDLWDVVIEVRSSNNTQPQTKQTTGNSSREKTSKPQQASGNRCDVRDRSVEPLSNVDHATTNANSSQGESQLFLFEDNEVVIKMIIKGRTPTIRHVSRTHRVTLDWLFDRINLNSKIQIKAVDTKNQLADILTKGSFARNEWDHLLKLLNIMNFSICSCSHFLWKGKHSVMSKREQDRTSKEGPAVAKPKQMSLVARSLLSSTRDPPQSWSASNDRGEVEDRDESSTSTSINLKPLRGDNAQIQRSKL